MKAIQEKKKTLKKELSRVSKMLHKKYQVNFTISWNRKRKKNTIQTKDIVQLKENGECKLVGIVYFTVTGEKTLLIGQTMLLLDRNGKEISCTNFFIKKKRVIELSYLWEDGIRLMASSIVDYIHDAKKFVCERVS